MAEEDKGRNGRRGREWDVSRTIGPMARGEGNLPANTESAMLISHGKPATTHLIMPYRT